MESSQNNIPLVYVLLIVLMVLLSSCR